MNVIKQCVGKLEPIIKQFFLSLMSGDGKPVNSQVQCHEVIYDLYCCAPQILSGVVPYITGELLVTTHLLVFRMLCCFLTITHFNESDIDAMIKMFVV